MTESAVDVVVPVWRPDIGRLERVVAGALDQQVPTRVVMVLDGPDEPVERALGAFCGREPRARFFVAPRSGTDIVTRQHVLDHETSQNLVFIDDDVMPTPTLVSQHLEALSTSGGFVMGRLRTVVEPKKNPLRPAALILGKWYQDARRLWLADPAAAYTWFWAVNFSCSRSTLARIGRFMPDFGDAYGLDGFYGLIARELGVPVVYHDEIVGDHLVQKQLTKVPSIGYAYGRSTVIMARGVQSLLPEQAEKFRAQITRFDNGKLLSQIEHRYNQHPETFQELIENM